MPVCLEIPIIPLEQLVQPHQQQRRQQSRVTLTKFYIFTSCHCKSASLATPLTTPAAATTTGSSAATACKAVGADFGNGNTFLYWFFLNALADNEFK